MADSDPFFIGWARPPRALQGVIVAMCLGILGLFGAIGYLLAAGQSDPGPGGFQGRRDITGMLVARPYPMVHVIRSKDDRVPAGRTLLLSGAGKRGVQARSAPLDGRLVDASGVALRRGDLDMLQLRGGRSGLRPSAAEPVPLPEPESLGRWRLAGEICDGKCYAGAMRPGIGLAHKACANLCLSGGVPPVLVLQQPLQGERFLLLADRDGGPVTGAVRDHTAVPVTIEGDVSRVGSILLFSIDPASIRRAP